MKKLLYLEIYDGLEVIDKEGSIGKIISSLDIHNIEVKFDDENGEGLGLYCLDPSCDEYEPLYKKCK